MCGFIGQSDVPGSETIRAFISLCGRDPAGTVANAAFENAPYGHITADAGLGVRADLAPAAGALRKLVYPKVGDRMTKREFVTWHNMKNKFGQCSWAVIDDLLYVRTARGQKVTQVGGSSPDLLDRVIMQETNPAFWD